MIKIFLFLLLFYYSWKLLGRLLFGGKDKIDHEAFRLQRPLDEVPEKDVTKRARVVNEE